METLTAVLATFAAGWFARSVTRSLREHADALVDLKSALRSLEREMKELYPLIEFARAVPALELEVYFLKQEVFGDTFGDMPTLLPRTTRRH